MSRIRRGFIHVSRGMDRKAESSRPRREIFFAPASPRPEKPAVPVSGRGPSLLACCHAGGRRSGTSKTAERNAALFAKCYGVNAPHGTGLAAIAIEFGITESRACQLVGVMLGIASQSVLPQGLAEVFDVIEATAKQHLPCAPDHLERALRPLLGDSLSIPDVSRFARDVLGKPLLTLETYINKWARRSPSKIRDSLRLKACHAP